MGAIYIAYPVHDLLGTLGNMAAFVKSRPRGLIRIATLLVPCALLLSACGPSLISDDRFVGLPEGVKISAESQSPVVLWNNKPESITISTWGSSSCPPDAVDMELGPENTLTIHFESANADVCTADLVPTTHVLKLPDEVQYSPLKVKISLDGVIAAQEYMLS